MNHRELRAQMIRNDVSWGDLAKALNMKVDSVQDKVYNERKFSPAQILAVTEAVGLTLEQIDLIFFDRKLPAGELKLHRQ